MLGAIIGDIAGSRFERRNIKSKDFELFTYQCHVADDSIISLAIASAILDSHVYPQTFERCAAERMQELGRMYPHCGFGKLCSGKSSIFPQEMGATQFSSDAFARNFWGTPSVVTYASATRLAYVQMLSKFLFCKHA